LNEHLRIAIDHLHEGIQVLGFDWRYLYLNETAARHGGRLVEELIGNRIQDCYPGIAETPMFSAMSKVMSSRVTEAFRKRFVLPEGTGRWFDLRVQPVPSGICVLSIDVTDEQETHERLRATEMQLQQLQKLESVGRLAGGVAHDFNNQLTVISGLTQFLLERNDLDAQARGDVSEIEAAAHRSIALTKQLLAFSRRQVLHVERIDLATVTVSTSRMLRLLLKENVRLELQIEPTTEPITADVSQIENVLANLAVNASDAMPEGGTLTLSTTTVELADTDVLQYPVMKRGRYSVLSVADTGVGMDEETKARIFEPFFTTKEAGKGTGLGLATVYGIVKQMGGFIWVSSNPGHGTTFKLYFPVSTRTVETEPVERTPDARPAHGEAVLVIEDDSAVREFVARSLEAEGYRVVSAASSREASERLQDTPVPFALVICDVVLPDVSGPSFVERARLFDTPVIFMSGYAAVQPEHRQLAGGYSLLEKPFTRQALAEVVHQTLRLSHE
jgi:two-component system, cell cycle sensor histidine kinase and response regulator CckA